MTRQLIMKLYDKANKRFDNTPELATYVGILMYDWPNFEEHLKWVTEAPTQELIEWAKQAEKHPRWQKLLNREEE